MLNPLASGLLLAAATNSMPARAISRSAVSVSEVLWGLLMDAMQLEHGAVSSNAQQYQYGAHARTHTHTPVNRRPQVHSVGCRGQFVHRPVIHPEGFPAHQSVGRGCLCKDPFAVQVVSDSAYNTISHLQAATTYRQHASMSGGKPTPTPTPTNNNNNNSAPVSKKDNTDTGHRTSNRIRLEPGGSGRITSSALEHIWEVGPKCIISSPEVPPFWGSGFLEC